MIVRPIALVIFSLKGATALGGLAPGGFWPRGLCPFPWEQRGKHCARNCTSCYWILLEHRQAECL